MMNEKDDDRLMEFVEEDSTMRAVKENKLVWRVLIIDDDNDVHSATTFALRSTEVVGRTLEFLHASSAREAKQLMSENKDIAVILLDVVMETPNAGLDLVPVIRDELKMKDTRIILRTGQPNQAPEIQVIRDYDINDYKLKSELTQSRLFASLSTAIRSYKQIQAIEAGTKSLGMIVKSSAALLSQQGIDEFAKGIIGHLCSLLSSPAEGLICIRQSANSNSNIIAATGQFLPFMHQSLMQLNDNKAQNCLLECLDSRKNSFNRQGLALYLGSEKRGDMACYVRSETEFDEVDESLLELFCSNIIICADNIELVAQLSEYAYYDMLSGLPNRNALVEEIDNTINAKKLSDEVLCMVDIDNFAEINASLGQVYGDDLLRAVGQRMRRQFPEPCMVARVAGDTFAVFGPSQCISQQKLLDAFEHAFNIENERQIISVTAGIVPISEVIGGGDEAIKDTTIVLKTAKNHSRGEVLLFRHNMVKDAQGRLSMLRHLRSAFELDQLFLVYQPKLRLHDLAVTGFESLVRWRDQHGNDIPPETFIPLAEQSGLIVRLGAWIFQESVKSLVEFHKHGWVDCHMSINLSVAQLQHSEILQLLRSTVANIGIHPKFINLEITESLAITDLESTLKLLFDIKKMGFSLSLDDFGTGYSSLNYLQKMPIDYLKLDKSLIDASHTKNGRDVVDMIINLAEKLGMEVVAEGVENGGQIEFLKSLHCTHAQGFYYAKPMEKSVLFQWMQNNENKNIP
ncbi:bifunctional diguanylate cyclase/phosphodiesterase [Agarilytica rhodophyticola]|uniref:bifunctional diguanylate cyclase/phosphodiesterase n=1 Tax=Agarilytica rhodophyticola TaxID=1737490 RepID=UPI000B347128|nr:EAL domain-containing protein [Agarilytica rhodophyticola]